MSARAGIVVTGTEVLSGIIADRNGPWLSERLRERGVDVGQIVVVGDRREDLMSALRQLAGLGVDVIVTTGGLGPTADDLTAEVVAAFTGREMVLDEALEARIWAILQRLSSRWIDLSEDAVRAANRKQAVIPAGATVLDPVGTAPGLVVTPASGDGPTVVVLPGPPRELQPMWPVALATEAVQEALAGAVELRRRMVRIFGIPESELANSLRAFSASGIDLEPLEITTCLRRGEIEVATVYEPAGEAAYQAFHAALVERHGDTVFAPEGETIDALVASALGGPPPRSVAVAESCTGGLLAGRLTDPPGASAYVLGGLTVYSDDAKLRLAGVPAQVLAAHGAVSVPVARALADGARSAFGADVGIGVTGIAGPGGGTAEKPVGTVCFSVAGDAGRLDRSVRLPGDRATVRDRTTTVALHLLRRLLLGERDEG